MPVPDRCPECGAERQGGLCPGCLIRLGLEGSALSLSRGTPGATVELGPRAVGVLDTIAATVGPVPRVLLRDTDGGSESPVVKPSSDAMPARLDPSGRYQLLGEIARGGMGAVLKGRDTDLGRDLAVKVLLEQHRDHPDLVRRFIEEAQIGGQLQHPGIVPVYELGTFPDSRPFFSMKLVKGRTLAELLAARTESTTELPRLLGIFEHVCQTMAYAHARGVIHRDLKPSNVMVGSFGEVQVMDWGLAKVLPRGGAVDDASAGKLDASETVIATARAATDNDQSQAGSVMGTPSYMAPEQARGEVDRVDERSDVFALGSILCEMLTSQPAFTGRSSGEIQRKAALGDLRDAVSRVESSGADPDLIALTKSCLSLERDDRPRHAGEVAERVDAYRTGVQERLRRAELERARAEARAVEEHKRRRLTLALAASIVALVTLGGGGAWWIAQQRQSRLAAVGAIVARIETLRDQAAAEGADSTRRREALADADQAVASIGDMRKSEPGLRLLALRAKIAEDEEQAKLDQTLIDELARHRTAFAEDSYGCGGPGRFDQGFSEAFRRYKMDLDTTPTGDAIRRLKAHPAAFVREALGAIDHWLLFSSEMNNEPGESAGPTRLRRVLDLARGLDPDPERNALRSLLEQGGLTSKRQELTSLAREAKIFELGPSTPLLLARSLAKAEDPKAASAVLRTSLVRYPGDAWTNLELAELLGNSDPPQRDEAIRYYTAFRALRPESGWNLISALKNQDRDDEAERLLEELSRVDSGNLTALSNVMFGLTGKGSNRGFDKRQTIVKRMVAPFQARLRDNPSDPVLHWKIAALSWLARDWSGGIAAYREAARLDPDNDGCRWELALMLLANHDLEGAIHAYRDAIRISPTYALYYEELADLLRRKGDLTGEIIELRRAIRCEALGRTQKAPVSHKSLVGLFEKEGCLGSYLGGHLAGTHAVLYEYADEGSYTTLAGALAESGDMDGAIVTCEEGIRLGEESSKPRTSQRYALLGKLYRNAGNRSGGLAAYRKAIELDPVQSEESRYELGLALAENTDLTGAVREFEEAVQQNSDPKMRPFRLLRVLVTAARPDDAEATLRSIRERVRDNPALGEVIDRAIGQFQNLSRSGARIPKFVRGSRSASFPMLCYEGRFFTASAAIWSAGFSTDPSLAADMKARNRYNAACSAALAGCGQGRDAPPDETARAKLRAQALDWLKADLAAWLKSLDPATPKERKAVEETLRHWRRDTDLAGLRDQDALAKLPEAERKGWEAFWADVADLLKKADAP